MKVLEVGCGTGLFSELISKLVPGLHIVAVDISPELIEQAKQRGLPPDQVEFVVARFEDCQLLGPFDAVVGSSILHHLDVADALAKMRALLRSRGALSFAEPNMLNPQIAIQKNVGFIKRRLGDSPDETAFTRRRLKRVLEQAGFIDVHVTPFDWLHPLTPRPLIPLVRTMGRAVERVPLLREFAGSVVCSATAP
jgi:2-polyprenyl-3-methyl-5-hydroxy-6-metoxy-1,4-benzoquinol methylase